MDYSKFPLNYTGRVIIDFLIIYGLVTTKCASSTDPKYNLITSNTGGHIYWQVN